MIEIDKKGIENLDHIKRLHLINSCTGVKSANLIGTIDENANTNLAIFNSVSHLGSSPPMITFLLRPKTVDRHTYKNIIARQDFTINHVPVNMVKEAHQTSAKYPIGVSEFDACGFTPLFVNQINAPFVAEANIQIGCKYINEYHIKEQDCHLIVGEIQLIRFDKEIQHQDGWLDAAKANSAGCIGLDGYTSIKLIDRYAYARPVDKTKQVLEK